MTFRRSALAVFVAAAALLAGCKGEKKPKDDPNVIATVNGEVLSRADFESELSRDLTSMEGLTPQSPEQLDISRRALLDTLVERMLLLQAAKASNIVVSPEEVDRGVLRISSDYPAEGFDEALAQGQLSMAELKQKTSQLLTIEKLFQSQVYSRAAVTEDEISDYFEAHPEEFEVPEEVHAQQIVVKGADDAKKVQAQLRAGKKFPDLARKYSLSADAKVGGDLGFFPRGVMPPKFDEICFKLGVGQVSDVVESEYGYHLFKVLEKKPASKKQLSDVRLQIEEKLLKEKRANAQKEFVKELRAKADIKVNEPALQSVTGKGRPDDARAEGAGR
ncbi:MAG: peptidyl-prolyl cis-trans isomerase [Myxococcaceae bacterium]